MVDESLVLFMINSFLLLSIDSSRVRFTYLQTQTQEVSLVAVVSLVVLVIKDKVAIEDCVRDVESLKVVDCVMVVLSGIVVGSVVLTVSDLVVYCVILVVSGKVVGSVVLTDSEVVVLFVMVVNCDMAEVCEHNTTLDGISFLAKLHVEQVGTSLKVLQLLRKQLELKVSTEYALHNECKSHIALQSLSVRGKLM